MSYITKTLLPNEQLLYLQRPHWIIFSNSMAWLGITILAMIFSDSWRSMWPMMLGTITIITAISAYITYKTSEYGITNQRVLAKIGFIRRYSLEIPLQRIESIQVYQSIMGRILNYGSLSIVGFGGSRDLFYNIPEPLIFRRKAQEQLISV